MSKYRKYNPEKTAKALKALSNPCRLRIFTRIAGNCCSRIECDFVDDERSCVGRLGAGLDVGPSTVSHHIKELREAGLIRVERQGQKMICSVEGKTLNALVDFFAELSGNRNGRKK